MFASYLLVTSTLPVTSPLDYSTCFYLTPGPAGFVIYQVEGGEGEEGEAALPRLDTHFFRHTRSSGRSRSFANTREVAARSVQYSTVQYSTVHAGGGGQVRTRLLSLWMQ